VIRTLTQFFEFVERVAYRSGLLQEHVIFLQTHFNAIMHKFIFKFGDVDRQMIEDICEFLLEYYGFLEGSGLVPDDELEEFRTLVQRSKPKLIQKMECYNAIRHDDEMDEDEKEAIREELFEGDHAWPNL